VFGLKLRAAVDGEQLKTEVLTKRMIPVESDDWRVDGAKITSDLSRLQMALERTVLILEHWSYRGSKSPERTFWEEFDDLKKYLETEVRPGDLLYFWEFDKTCKKDNVLAAGKYPDEKGRVPVRGAY
jgi:hypothetical protein